MTEAPDTAAENVEVVERFLAAAGYRLAAGRIVHIEQHDCYGEPSPAADGATLPP